MRHIQLRGSTTLPQARKRITDHCDAHGFGEYRVTLRGRANRLTHRLHLWLSEQPGIHTLHQEERGHVLSFTWDGSATRQIILHTPDGILIGSEQI